MTLLTFAVIIVSQDKKWSLVHMNTKVVCSHFGEEVASWLKVWILLLDTLGVKYWLVVTLSTFLTSLCFCFLLCKMRVMTTCPPRSRVWMLNEAMHSVSSAHSLFLPR